MRVPGSPIVALGVEDVYASTGAFAEISPRKHVSVYSRSSSIFSFFFLHWQNRTTRVSMRLPDPNYP